MEESKECDQMGLALQDGSTGNHIQSDFIAKNEIEMSNININQLHICLVEISPSPIEVQREKAEKLYYFMSVSMSCIIQEIDKRRRDELKLMGKIMWFSHIDKRIERLTQVIKNCEEALSDEKTHLPMRSIPRTTGFLHLTEEDAETPVHIGIGRKRCHNRLKKDRMDLQYMKHIQEELLSSMKPQGRPADATQELNDVMVSLVQRIQHGNSNHKKESKIFHEIRNINDTIETYTAPILLSPYHYYRAPRDVGGPRGRARHTQYYQHTIKLLSNEVDEMKRDQIGRIAKINRLNAELIIVRKNIKCMERVLVKVYTKRMKAHRCAYKLRGEKEMKSSYNESISLMTYGIELARTANFGDFDNLMQICDKKVEEFMGQWYNNKALGGLECHSDLNVIIPSLEFMNSNHQHDHPV